MTLAALVFVLVVAIVLGWFGRRRLARLFYALAAIGFLAIGCGPLPWWMLTRLQSGLSARIPHLSGKGRTAIIVLGGGTEFDSVDKELRVPPMIYGRLTKTVEVYRECRAFGDECSVLVSGGNPQKHELAEADVYGRELAALGVEVKDLVLENRSLNTWQNAQFTAKLLPPKTLHLVLVTSGLHLARAQLYFAHFGVHATPVRADFERAQLSPIPLGANFLLADAAIHEYLGIARYYVYEAFGWNVAATGARAL